MSKWVFFYKEFNSDLNPIPVTLVVLRLFKLL